MKHWPAQEAKARFSGLLRAAGKRPQRITVRGKPAAVLLSDAEYRRLCGESDRPKRTFAEWWKSAPRVPEFKSPERGRRSKVRPVKTEARKKTPKTFLELMRSAPPGWADIELPPRK